MLLFGFLHLLSAATQTAAPPAASNGQAKSSVTVQTRIDDAFLRIADTDVNGHVDLGEFISYQEIELEKKLTPEQKAKYTPEKRQDFRKGLASMFRALDVDHDGVLTGADRPKPNDGSQRFDPRDIAAMMQISIAIPSAMTAADRNARAKWFLEATRKIDTCKAASTFARENKTEVVRIPRFKLSDIPKPLRDQILLNPVGRATRPFYNDSRLHVLVRCDQLPKA